MMLSTALVINFWLLHLSTWQSICTGYDVCENNNFWIRSFVHTLLWVHRWMPTDDHYQIKRFVTCNLQTDFFLLFQFFYFTYLFCSYMQIFYAVAGTELITYVLSPLLLCFNKIIFLIIVRFATSWLIGYESFLLKHEWIKMLSFRSDRFDSL